MPASASRRSASKDPVVGATPVLSFGFDALRSSAAEISRHPTSLLPPSFRFQPREALLDLRQLSEFDPASIAQRSDVEALQRVLAPLTFGRLSDADARSADRVQPHASKLFRLSQLCVEYMLHVQGVLQGHAEGLSSRRDSAMHRATELEQRTAEVRAEARRVRREARRKARQLEACKASVAARQMLLAVHRPQQQAVQAVAAPPSQSGIPQDVVDSLRRRITELEMDVRREREDADGLRRKLAASEGTREDLERRLREALAELDRLKRELDAARKELLEGRGSSERS